MRTQYLNQYNCQCLLCQRGAVQIYQAVGRGASRNAIPTPLFTCTSSIIFEVYTVLRRSYTVKIFFGVLSRKKS